MKFRFMVKYSPMVYEWLGNFSLENPIMPKEVAESIVETARSGRGLPQYLLNPLLDIIEGRIK